MFDPKKVEKLITEPNEIVFELRKSFAGAKFKLISIDETPEHVEIKLKINGKPAVGSLPKKMIVSLHEQFFKSPERIVAESLIQVLHNALSQ